MTTSARDAAADAVGDVWEEFSSGYPELSFLSDAVITALTIPPDMPVTAESPAPSITRAIRLLKICDGLSEGAVEACIEIAVEAVGLWDRGRIDREIESFPPYQILDELRGRG